MERALPPEVCLHEIQADTIQTILIRREGLRGNRVGLIGRSSCGAGWSSLCLGRSSCGAGWNSLYSDGAAVVRDEASCDSMNQPWYWMKIL
ncbi:MAG: hypothetical protein ACLTI1_00230 [Clostridia bacterium]